MDQRKYDIQQIERIRRMEQYLNAGMEAVERLEEDPSSYEKVRPMLKILSEYYGSLLWFQDREDDAAGRLPEDLARGVLTEDYPFDLICDFERIEKQRRGLRMNGNVVKKLLECKVGDFVQFGRYYQESPREKTPIKWKVLDVQKEQALLLAERCLITSGYCDHEEIQKDPSYGRWQNCVARRKCHEFFREAFLGVERQFLLSKKVQDRPMEAGILEQVFLLSEEEVVKYLPEEERRAMPTPVALANGAYKAGFGEFPNHTCWWILPHLDQNDYPQAVFPNGEIHYHGRNVYHKDWTIRPCILLDLKYLKKEINSQSSIEIAVGDITKFDGDCIVNAANKSLLGGSGVDGAIHKAAGSELYYACKLLGGCETGHAKITKGYNLKARHVIHTVGPIYSGKPTDAVMLASCYRGSLNVAKANGLHTIAFPSISTGAYGYPLEAAAKLAMKAMIDWVSFHSDYEMHITMMCFSEKNEVVYRKAHQSQRYAYWKNSMGQIYRQDVMLRKLYVLTEQNVWDTAPAGMYAELEWGSLPMNQISMEENYPILTMENVLNGEYVDKTAQYVQSADWSVPQEVDKTFRAFCEKYRMFLKLLHEDAELRDWCKSYSHHYAIPTHRGLQKMIYQFVEDASDLPFFVEYVSWYHGNFIQDQTVTAGQPKKMIAKACWLVRAGVKTESLEKREIGDGMILELMEMYLQMPSSEKNGTKSEKTPEKPPVMEDGNTLINDPEIAKNFDWNACLKKSPVLKQSPHNPNIFECEGIATIFASGKKLELHPSAEKCMPILQSILEEALRLFYNRKIEITAEYGKYGGLEKLNLIFKSQFDGGK